MIEGADAVGTDGVVTLRTAAPYRRAGPELRRNEPLRFEPVERRIDRAGRHLAIETVLDLFQNRPPVGFLPERRSRLDEREEDRLFERTEVLCQSVYIVDKPGAMSIADPLPATRLRP